MSLIYCKVKLRFIWEKHCVLPMLGTENNDANSDNIIFTHLSSKRQSKTFKTSLQGI